MAMVKCPECNGDISDKALTCPHCGFPIKVEKEEQYDYVLTTGNRQVSGLSGTLRVLAVITWIGGLIISIVGANVADSLYSSSSHFSFGTFLSLLAPYVLYGIILMGVATLADQIADTNSIVAGLGLKKQTQSKTASVSNSKGSYLSKASHGDWTCPVCSHTNHSWDETCTHCGEPKRR